MNKTILKIVFGMSIMICISSLKAEVISSENSVQPSNISHKSAIALGHDVYILPNDTRGFASQGEAQIDMLRRCAQLTLSKDAKFFVILDPNVPSFNVTIQIYKTGKDTPHCAMCSNVSQVFDASIIDSNFHEKS